MSVKRALVTGATGMLGSHIAETLQKEGWAVRALVRTRDRAGWLESIGIEVVEGSLEQQESMAEAAASCSVVFHSAAAIGSGGDWESFRAANVLGTENVVSATAGAGARLVHVSSTSVYGADRYFDEPTTEDHPLPELPDYDVYGRSKQLAESVVLDAHRAGRVWATVVRPPVMYGERDRQFAPRLAPVLLRGVFPRIAGGTAEMAMVNARHVAEGAVLAGSTDAAGGQAYLLTNDFPVTVNDLIRCAEEGLGRRIFAPHIPMPVGRVGFSSLGLALKLFGRGDLARHASGTLNMLTKDNPFTSRRAREELGWSPSVHPDEGLTEAFRSWRRTQETENP